MTATLVDHNRTVSSMDERPLHAQVRAAILADLVGGKWKPGEHMPTEAELARRFDVSEGTVRQAMVALAKEGRVTRRSGKGTFAARPNFDRSFERFFRFRDGRADEDPQYGVRVIALDRDIAVAQEIADALGLPAGQGVLRVHRAIEQHGITVCHSLSYLRQDRFGALLAHELDDAAFYDVMQTHFGVHIVRVVETLQARMAGAADCSILGVPHQSPVIAIERRAFTFNHEILEIRHTVARSDRFSYQIELS